MNRVADHGRRFAFRQLPEFSDTSSTRLSADSIRKRLFSSFFRGFARISLFFKFHCAKFALSCLSEQFEPTPEQTHVPISPTPYNTPSYATHAFLSAYSEYCHIPSFHQFELVCHDPRIRCPRSAAGYLVDKRGEGFAGSIEP